MLAVCGWQFAVRCAAWRRQQTANCQLTCLGDGHRRDCPETGRRERVILPVRVVRAAAGAGYVYAISGDMRTMPGLPKNPAAAGIDLDELGEVVGLF